MATSIKSIVRREWPLPLGIATTVLFLCFGKEWLGNLSNPAWFGLMLGWLFGAISISAFAVVRHAEALAERVREPFGTLILTLSMSGMEMLMIASVMYFGGGGSSLGRDTMLAILMVVLNGLVGTSLLVGGLRYHEQTYNLYGANAFLSLIVPLSVLGLVMPSFTVSSPGPTLSALQSAFLIVMSLGLYGVFLAIQTMRHRDYFVLTNAARDSIGHAGTRAVHDGQSTKHHTLLLLAYVPFIVLLAKQIARPIDYGTNVLGVPPALGGLLVATLILLPESLAAVRAAGANQ